MNDTRDTAKPEPGHTPTQAVHRDFLAYRDQLLAKHGAATTDQPEKGSAIRDNLSKWCEDHGTALDIMIAMTDPRGRLRADREGHRVYIPIPDGYAIASPHDCWELLRSAYPGLRWRQGALGAGAIDIQVSITGEAVQVEHGSSSGVCWLGYGQLDSRDGSTRLDPGIMAVASRTTRAGCPVLCVSSQMNRAAWALGYLLFAADLADESYGRSEVGSLPDPLDPARYLAGGR